MFESALVSLGPVDASGTDAYMLHVIPTPGVSYSEVVGGADCGVMITLLTTHSVLQHQAGQQRRLQDG